MVDGWVDLVLQLGCVQLLSKAVLVYRSGFHDKPNCPRWEWILVYEWLGQLSLLPLAGWEMSSSYGYGWRPSVADWGDGVSASCTVGPIVR